MTSLIIDLIDTATTTRRQKTSAVYSLFLRDTSSDCCGESRPDYTHIADITEKAAYALVDAKMAFWRCVPPSRKCPCCGGVA